MIARAWTAFSLVLLAISIAGCASAPERIADTPSGWPQVTISSDDTQYIQSWIINRMTNKGWSLDSQSNNGLKFTKTADTSSVKTVLLQAMIGNSYSTTPKLETNYSIASLGDSTNVVAQAFVSTQMAMGQVNRIDFKNNNAVFNDIQRQLNKLKSEVEARVSNGSAKTVASD
jgi:hypothetical protein